MKTVWPTIAALIIIMLIHSCQVTADSPAGKDGWLAGNVQEKFETVASQFRGFDMAMVETGYRYQELYWAGQDGNWKYAEYQVGKIRKAIKNGLERRPKRAQSAKHFLNNVLPEMQKAVNSKDTVTFNKYFQILTISCNNCHAIEKVPFFTVKFPTKRQSPIRK